MKDHSGQCQQCALNIVDSLPDLQTISGKSGAVTQLSINNARAAKDDVPRVSSH